ncbi:hypothetical protein SLS62_000894 [Diatrype stigma]|uniref:Uncharacterized protein n=1 Tax=Diatrype stigma TaxID=117547 RepID=A0AAN9VB43_9PEZI
MDPVDENGEQQEMEDDKSSPFTEFIIVATICGRTLEHKQQPLSDAPLHSSKSDNQQGQHDAIVYEFCRRHQFLNSALTRRIKFLSLLVSSNSGHPDPALVFVTLLAYMALFVLCDTALESPSSLSSNQASQATQVADALLLEHKRRSLDAVHELSVLIATLSQLNHFQTHPLTPIPLLLSARFCLAHSRGQSNDDSYSTLVPKIATALQGLTSVNGLAQHCLWLLGSG